MEGVVERIPGLQRGTARSQTCSLDWVRSKLSALATFQKLGLQSVPPTVSGEHGHQPSIYPLTEAVQLLTVILCFLFSPYKSRATISDMTP